MSRRTTTLFIILFGFVTLSSLLTNGFSPSLVSTLQPCRVHQNNKSTLLFHNTNKNKNIVSEGDVKCSLSTTNVGRRMIIQKSIATTIVGIVSTFGISSSSSSNTNAWGVSGIQDSLDIETFLRTGIDTGGGMTVSSQTGKSRPITGVIFRDGTETIQDPVSGIVTSEVLTGTKAIPTAVIVQFTCPKYKLETSSVFDIECRDSRTGDGVFVAVTEPLSNNNIDTVPQSVLLNRLFSPTGRFSLYGAPTDIKVRNDWTTVDDNTGISKRFIELSFANLAQSTNAEILRRAILVAIIPPGTQNAILLVASSTSSRWTKGGIDTIMKQIINSFQVIPSPKTNLKLRAKDRFNRDIF